MTNLSSNKTRSYHLDIKEDLHWELVRMGADFKLDHESFVEFAIENALLRTLEKENEPKVEANPETPLYKRLINEFNLYSSLWPDKFSLIFQFIADVIEARGVKDLDRDPGETADWLRQEAEKCHAADADQ